MPGRGWATQRAPLVAPGPLRAAGGGCAPRIPAAFPCCAPPFRAPPQRPKGKYHLSPPFTAEHTEARSRSVMWPFADGAEARGQRRPPPQPEGPAA